MTKVINAIIRKEDKILLIKRKEGLHSGKWAFPGGVMQNGESEKEALIREIKEETGLDIKKIIRKIASYSYKREDNSKTLGASHLVEVENFNVHINSESEDYKWADLEDLENLDCVEGIEEEAMKALYS